VLSFWSNCKLRVKLQASFALVMVAFAAAIIGIFVANAKVDALATLQSTSSGAKSRMLNGHAPGIPAR
jgi:thiol:disulfide interchange protein